MIYPEKIYANPLNLVDNHSQKDSNVLIQI